MTIDSYLGWWRDAGLVDGIGDAPHDWFASPAAVQRAESAKMVQSPSPPFVSETPVAAFATQPRARAVDLPTTVATFDVWLATTTDFPGHDWSARCLPAGSAGAPVMLLSDVPDADDILNGALFSGAVGRLLDAMLGAIGHARADVRLASIALTRPVAGRIEGGDGARLVAIARHHVALVQPRFLVLLGQQANELFGAGFIPDVNHDGTNMVTVAIHHPRLLIERPLLKRQAWDVLKTLKEPG